MDLTKNLNALNSSSIEDVLNSTLVDPIHVSEESVRRLSKVTLRRRVSCVGCEPKRKREEEDEDVARSCVYAEARKGIEDLKGLVDKWLRMKDRNRMSNVQIADASKMFFGLAEITERMIRENEFLSGRIKEKERAKKIRHNPAVTGTYASIAASMGTRLGQKKPPATAPIKVPGVGTTKVPPSKNYSVVISSEVNPEASAEEIREVLKSTLNPSSEGIRVRNVRRAKSGKAVVVDLQGKEDMQKLAGHAKLKEKGLKSEVPTSRSPRLIIYDVPAELTPEGEWREIRRYSTEYLRKK